MLQVRSTYWPVLTHALTPAQPWIGKPPHCINSTALLSFAGITFHSTDQQPLLCFPSQDIATTTLLLCGRCYPPTVHWPAFPGFTLDFTAPHPAVVLQVQSPFWPVLTQGCTFEQRWEEYLERLQAESVTGSRTASVTGTSVTVAPRASTGPGRGTAGAGAAEAAAVAAPRPGVRAAGPQAAAAAAVTQPLSGMRGLSIHSTRSSSRAAGAR